MQIKEYHNILSFASQIFLKVMIYTLLQALSYIILISFFHIDRFIYL